MWPQPIQFFPKLITRAPIPARASTTSVFSYCGDPPEPTPTEPPSTAFDTSIPLLHQLLRPQRHIITPVTPPPTMSHATPRTLIAEDLIATPLHLGIVLHRPTMAVIPLIVRDALVTITVKALRDTTLLDKMQTDRAGEHYIQAKHT